MAGDEDSARFEDADGGRPVGLIISGVVGVLFLIFMLQNTEQQSVKFLFFDEFSAPTWLMLLVAVVVGALLGQVALWFWRRRGD